MTSKAAYVLLDRSGSMHGRMPAALDNIRTFLAGLTKEGHGDTHVKLFAFDSGNGVTPYRINSLSRVQPNTSGLRLDMVSQGPASEFVIPQVYANGGTPLFDAIGRLAGMALEDSAEKGSLIIFTDGEENSSSMFTAKTSKALLDAVRAKGWQVEQVGIEYDVRAEAASMGTQRRDTYTASAADMAKGVVGMSLASTRSAYYSGAGGQSLSEVAESLSKGGK